MTQPTGKPIAQGMAVHFRAGTDRGPRPVAGGLLRRYRGHRRRVLDPGEQLPPTTPGPSAVLGFPTRAQLVQRYAQLSGRDVSNLPYWVAFSRWRSACIGVGVRARYLAGHMGDDGFAATLLTSAEPGAVGNRVVLAEAARDALRAAGP